MIPQPPRVPADVSWTSTFALWKLLFTSAMLISDPVVALPAEYGCEVQAGTACFSSTRTQIDQGAPVFISIVTLTATQQLTSPPPVQTTKDALSIVVFPALRKDSEYAKGPHH